MTPGIEQVKDLCSRYTNWGRFGADDELGTLNHITPADVTAAAALVRHGITVPMGIEFGAGGPQTGAFGRFNPIHLMIKDGNDAVSETAVRDFYGGRDRSLRATDDVLFLPLQSATHWDSLAHVIFEGKMYNGFSASEVSSRGALRNDVTHARDKMIGRGVLLDVPAARGVPWLEPGYAITRADLEACEEHAGVQVQRGDFVFVRTGQMAQVAARGSWGDFAGGDAPGLGLDAVPWVTDNEIAALATDTWGMEVRPNETAEVLQPLHIVLLVHVGLWIGEIFDLEPIARECAARTQFEFLFTGSPLPVSHAVGAPAVPTAVF